ncbi:MAG: hypothetical protein ACHP79_07185 [Terriglobales bacterium]
MVLGLAAHAAQKTVEQIKSEAAAASGGQQARLYAELAQRLVDVAAEQFAQNDIAKGQATVQEILDYAAKAHDIALDTRSKMKEVEIHLRQTQRHLESLKRTLVTEDRPPLDAAEKTLAGYRQELMDAMFAPKKKETKK